MSSNQIGACSLTPGSSVVTFDSFVNMSDMLAGDLFRITSDNTFYTIASVNVVGLSCILSSNYYNSDYTLYVDDGSFIASVASATQGGKLDSTPVIPGTVTFVDGSSIETFTDNGDGTLTGNNGGSGVITYSDGSAVLTYYRSISAGITIYADYGYGISLSQMPFQIVRDYTPHFSWPEPHASDQSHQAITRQAIRLIDNDLYSHGARTFDRVIYGSTTNVSVAVGLYAITIPYISNGYNLTDVIASVHTKGVTGTTDIQIRRRRAGSDVDMLSTKVTIGDEYYARDGTADTNYDDIQTGDQIYFDVDAVHTTPPKGLSVTLTFQKV